MSEQQLLDSLAKEYINPIPERQVDQYILTLLTEYIIPRFQHLPIKNVLELGAGDQIWTPELLANFPSVTTIDASAELLQSLNDRLANPRWTSVCTLFEDYTPDERFDLIIATFVLEHVMDPKAILQRAKDHWLSDTGQMVVMVPHALSLHRRLAVTMGLAEDPAELGETDRLIGHRQVFSYIEMEKLLLELGLTIHEKQGLFCKSLPYSILKHCSKEQLAGLVKLGLELPIEYSSIIYYLVGKK